MDSLADILALWWFALATYRAYLCVSSTPVTSVREAVNVVFWTFIAFPVLPLHQLSTFEEGEREDEEAN